MIPGAPVMAEPTPLAPRGPVVFCRGQGHRVYTGNGQCPTCRGFAVKVVDEADRDRALGGDTVPARPVRELVPKVASELGQLVTEGQEIDPYLQQRRRA